MKANTKKLLSLLMAVAMVLSMAPAISLQAEAAEFDATTTVCEACGAAPTGGWTRISDNSVAEITADGHYYLDTDWSKSSKAGMSLPAYNICLHLNGHSITGTASNGRGLSLANAVEVNIMGTGTITGATGGAMYLTGGTVNTYGGTYTGSGKFVTVSGSTLNVKGGTFSHDPTSYVDTSKYDVTASGSTWTVTKKAPAFSLEVCPGCGDTVTEWQPVDAATGANAWTKGSGHFYLTKDLSSGAKRVMQFDGADEEICLHLNGKNITSTSTTAGAITVRVAGTLRIMGEGTITAGSNEPLGAVVANTGSTVEVYGGTYVGQETVRINGGTIKVFGGTYPKEIVSFLQPGYECTENTDGTWTVSKLALSCDHCDEENITWEPYAGGYIGVADDATVHHYYLADDVNSTASWAVQNQTGAASAVLNLNGKTLTFTGGIRTRSGANLYIVGSGSVIRNESDTDAVLEANSTNLYIMGGNFRNNDADVAMFSGEKFVITGGTFNADPSAFVAEGYKAVESDGIWTVTEGHACVWGEGVQTQAPTCTAEGVMTYTCTVEGCGATRTESIAKLDHDFSANGPTCANCTEANPNYVSNLPTVCPGCEKTVTEWKPVTNGYGDNGWTTEMNGHYYIANEITGSGKRVFSFPAGTDVCLHLNGQTVTSTATTASAITMRVYGTLRLMGEGTVSSGENTTAMAPVAVYDGGVVKVYGGTYLAKNNEVAVRAAQSAASITIYGGTHSKVSPAFIPEGYVSTENEDGTFTVAKKTGPALPTECPCGAKDVVWTELTSAGFGASATTHNHYYISENTTITGTANSLQTYADQCIYLPEGLTLTNNGRLRLRDSKNVYIFGNGNYVHADSETAYGMFESASGGYLYIFGGNFTDNETNGVAPFSGTRYVITGGTFNFDPSAYVPDGYKATKEGDIWTVAEYVAPPYPVNCPMCGTENVTWTEVDKATGDTGFAASGHYILVDDIIGTAKRVFSVPAEMEVCLYLNGWNITGSIVNNAPVALRSYGTLRVGGEGTVSTPNVTGEGATWGVVAADGENAVVKIYGGTYIDGAARNQAVRASNGGVVEVYGGTFSNVVATSFLAENKWALPKADKWDVVDLTAAAIITDDGYQTFATTEEAVAAYNGGYILMGSADSIELTKDAYVNNNGKNVTVTGEGALKPIGENNGSWDLTDANVQRDTTDPVTGERFLTVGDQTYSFKMKVNKVVLRPGTTSETLGIYYKTEIIVGEELANLIECYGVALSLVEMPTAEDILAVDSHAMYTVVNNDLVAGSNERTSGLLKGILKESYTAEELVALSTALGRDVTTTAEANSLRGELKIYANAYIALDLDGDGDGEEEFIMADVEYNNIENTLKGIMGKVDAMAEIPQAGINCYKAWAPLGMDTWGLTNLAAKAAE